MNIAYQVYFMRKLWFNVMPGRDQEADCIFHYPQVNSIFFLPPFFFLGTCDLSRSNLRKLGSEELIRWMVLLTCNTSCLCTQELPKYMRGYHSSTKEEMVQLAALLFRVKMGDDNTQFVMVTKMLKELVPNDQLKAMSAEDWKKVGIMHIVSLTLSMTSSHAEKSQHHCSF